MYAFSGADSARTRAFYSFHLARRKLLAFVSAATIATAAQSSNALADGNYFMAPDKDGVQEKTDDLEKAAASWRTAEFLKDHALAGMKAEYAYARGIAGKGVKVGAVDSGILDFHPQLLDQFSAFTVSGTYGLDGFRYEGKEASIGTWKAGEKFSIPGIYDPLINDSHGTAVAGEIVAKRDGQGMHGVAFDAHLLVANSGGTDSTLHGPTVDYNYFKEAYGILARNGARAINSSWGQQYSLSGDYGTTGGLARLYGTYGGKKTYLDAAAEVSQQYGTIQVWSNGNENRSNPGPSASLPYFRPEIEQYWIGATGIKKDGASIFDRCGVAKYWCMAGPTSEIYTTSVGRGGEKYDHGHGSTDLVKDPPVAEYYGDYGGTSASAPHITASLALVMARYPYMTNTQARDVLFTTATHLNDSRVVNDNPAAPNTTFGWGKPDLNRAMKGPGQFLGRFAANLEAGTADIWSNDISQAALDQRKSEETQEIAQWAEKKTASKWGNDGPTDAQIEGIVKAQRDSVPRLLSDLVDTLRSGTYNGDNSAIQKNPLAASVFERFLANSRYGGIFPHIKDYPPQAIMLGIELMNFVNFGDSSVREADFTRTKELLKAEYSTAVSRTTYLATKTSDAGLTKSGSGTLTLAGKNTYRGDTIVDGGELAIAKGGSIISSAIVNDTGLFTVDGSAADVSVNKRGALRVGESGKTLGLYVDGGTARIDGFSDMASVRSGGVLSGTGKLGNLDMREGGHVAPGHSIGTLTVTGDVTFAKGSFYDVEIAPDLDKAGELKADLLSVDGKAELLGGIVSVSLENEKTLMSKEQIENLFLRKGVILTATQGVSGQFERVLPEYNYITGLLDYGDAGKVSLGFDLTDAEKEKIANKLKADLLAAQEEAKRLQAEKLAADKAEADLLAAQDETKRLQAEELVANKLKADKAEADLLAAQNEAKRLQIEMLKQAVAGLTMENDGTTSYNQKAVFDAVKALGYGNALTNTIFLKERGEVLPYDNLSGEAHATLSGVLARDASVIGNAAQNRIRAAFDGVTVKEQAVIASPLAYAPAKKARASAAFDAHPELVEGASVTPAPATTALWGEAYAGWAHAGGDGNAAGYSRNAGGFVTGLDGVVADDWRVGVLAGYARRLWQHVAR